MTTPGEITRMLDQATAPHRLLDHAFYRAWSEGTLTKEDLGFYATQYWRQVESFPGYLGSLESRLPEGRARAIVADNLADERDDDHPGLWLRFAEGLGVDEATVRNTDAEPETKRCVETFESGTQSSSVMFALGMLYGYESQTPEVSKTKVEGLRTHYGIAGPSVEYFALHGELDVEHAAELSEAVVAVAADPADFKQAREGAVAGAKAVHGLLDGVARVRDIC